MNTDFSDMPVLLALRCNEGWKVWCPFCRVWHFHSEGDGVRVAHCFDGSPWADKKYYVLRSKKFKVASPVKPKRIRPSRVQISPKLRFFILKRDKFTCKYCGRKPNKIELRVDHKISVKDNGTDHPENLVTSCFECNAGKGSKSVS